MLPGAGGLVPREGLLGLCYIFFIFFSWGTAHVACTVAQEQRIFGVNTQSGKTHLQKKTKQQPCSLTALQLAHTSKCSPFDGAAPSGRRWERGGDGAPAAGLRAFLGEKFEQRDPDLVKRRFFIVKTQTADYVFNLGSVQVEKVFFFFNPLLVLAAQGEAGTGS